MPRGIDQDRQVLLDSILAGEFVQPTRSNGRLQGELVLGDLRAGDALDRHALSPAGCRESNM
jgi:hypothetical protein